MAVSTASIKALTKGAGFPIIISASRRSVMHKPIGMDG
jgi:hypothetical protein